MTHRIRILAAVLASLSVVTLSMASPIDRWSEFDPEPLTILYPEDEALSNPPFFHWQRVEGAARYEVVLQSPEGEKRWSVPRNFFTPSEILPAGYCTVKVTPYDASDAALLSTKTKTFHLPEGRPGLSIGMNDIASSPGSRVAFSDSDIRSIQTDSGMRGDFRDRLIALAKGPKPERLVEYAEPEPYTDEKWNYEQWNRNNSLCFAIEDYVVGESVAYRLTGDAEFADRAKEILLTIATWDPAGPTGVWSNDHSSWSILHALSIGYDSLGDRLSPEEKKLVTTAIVGRCRDMYRFLNPFVSKNTSGGVMNDPDNNHPWFCTAALGFGGLTLLDQIPEAKEWVAFATQMFHGVYLPRGGIDGGWHEGIDYWSYTLFFVFQFADALHDVTRINLYDHPWLRNTAFFKIYVHPPRGGYVPFGDCKHQQPTDFDKLIMMRLASRFDDPMAWHYVDAVSHDIPDSRLVPALLWSDREGAPDIAQSSYPFAFQFRDIGWVVSNNDVFDSDRQVILAFRSGRFFGRRFGHSHADQNQFILTAGGDKLLWDAGYYDSYLSPHHRDYSSKSIAHNVILVGGEGQVPFTAGTDGRITRFESDPPHLVVQGDASKPLIYGGKVRTFLRTLDYVEAKSLVVTDEIFLSRADRISWLLHSAFPIIYDPEHRTLTIRGTHYELTGVFETDVPVDAILTTTFPHPAGQKGKQYNDPSDTPYPDQYHLELKTAEPLESWNPVARFTLHPIAAGE